jgi:hypothetical protein
MHFNILFNFLMCILETEVLYVLELQELHVPLMICQIEGCIIGTHFRSNL